MRQEPFLLKDLMAVIEKLPDPNTFEFNSISMPILDSINTPAGEKSQTKEILFNKWKRVEGNNSQNYWVVWHTIAIK